MITFNQQYNTYNQYNNTYKAKYCNNRTIVKHSLINKIEKKDYNKIEKLKRKLCMDIDDAKKSEIGEILKKKSISLPETINSMFYNIGLYMQGGIKPQNFINYYCKQTESLYWRIAEGKEKEVFRESYAPELKVLTEIRNIVNDINSGTEQNTDKLDDVINTFSREYLKTPISRKKYFDV